ncbi:MAG TPA: efflux RND transporter periplasmic adaptor subunit [Deltaproteobacteria bacterium]|nr:efflux RND transporter periplasmic adaptor subunit [Deltaproteobacteria bacterium]
MNTVVNRVLLPLGILVAAIASAGVLVISRPEAERAVPETQTPRVEVIEVRPEDVVAQIEATGVVQPAQQITLTPQVSGRVVWQSDALMPGAKIEQGDVLARVDPTEYALLVEQAKSSVRAAEVELELERGRQRAAAREWALLGEGQAEAPLALRKPQLMAAEQALEAARAGLKQAELNLQRTYLVAPFNAVILEENIDRGQIVSPSTPVATLVGTDEVWVKVSIPVDQLPAVALPTQDTPGSPAKVRQRLGPDTSIVRDGAVVQLMAQLDPQTRTAALLVAVPNPMDTSDGQLPLMPGAYVDVAIDGRILHDVMSVPRVAIDGGDKVWVVEREGSLASRRVTIGWREAEDVVITKGLEPGSHVVISPLALPIEGMRVEAISSPEHDEAAPPELED